MTMRRRPMGPLNAPKRRFPRAYAMNEITEKTSATLVVRNRHPRGRRSPSRVIPKWYLALGSAERQDATPTTSVIHLHLKSFSGVMVIPPLVINMDELEVVFTNSASNNVALLIPLELF